MIKLSFFFKFTIVMNTHLLRMNMDVVNTTYPTLHNEHNSNSKINVKRYLACMWARFMSSFNSTSINARENRRGNKQWTIQRHWQHWVHKTQDKDKQNQSTAQKTKKMSNTDPTGNEHRCSRRVNSFCLL